MAPTANTTHQHDSGLKSSREYSNANTSRDANDHSKDIGISTQKIGNFESQLDQWPIML